VNGGQLLFGSQAWFPALWVLASLGFVAYWWYVCRGMGGLRRLFLALWVPAALASAAVYRLQGRGYALTTTLQLLARCDPETLRLVFHTPIDGPVLTYAVVVGGVAAALATIALQMGGIMLGALLMVTPAGRRTGRRR
jgi:hypothetical protein